MERALPVIILPREPRSSATETPMPRRVRLFGSMKSGVVCVLLATAAAGLGTPAQAECILQPNQQAPEGAHWSLHYDRDKNRRCWIMVDASGHDLSTPQQPADSSGLSTFQSFLDRITGGTSPPQQEAAPAGAPATPPRKPQPNVVNATRADPAARTEPKSEARPVKPMTSGERDALFEEFLRWHESQQITGAAKPAVPR